MTLQEILQSLIKSQSIDRNQLNLTKKSLLKMARKYEELEYSDQTFLVKAYDASLKLMVFRLRAGQDREPCRNLYELLLKAPPPGYGNDRFKWLEENSALQETEEANLMKVTSDELHKLEMTKYELTKLQICAKFAGGIEDENERSRSLKVFVRGLN